MYETALPEPLTPEWAVMEYADFLRDIPRFEDALARVITEWPISCEQFLSNDSINRVAWLGQSSMCIATGVPRVFRGGFNLLDDAEQKLANVTAFEWLNVWLQSQGEEVVVTREGIDEHEAED